MKRKLSPEEKARQKLIKEKSKRDNVTRHYKMVPMGLAHPLTQAKSKLDRIRRS